MGAAIALQARDCVGNRQRRQHRDFLRVHRFCHIGDIVHLVVHVLRELLYILHIQFPLDGVRLPEDLHFHRRAHGFSMCEDNTNRIHPACRTCRVLVGAQHAAPFRLPSCAVQGATRDSTCAALTGAYTGRSGNSAKITLCRNFSFPATRGASGPETPSEGLFFVSLEPMESRLMAPRCAACSQSPPPSSQRKPPQSSPKESRS